MAFNQFNFAQSVGMEGEFNPEDLLDDLDDDDYHTHHTEKVNKPEAPHPSTIELERIRQKNLELEAQMQNDRVAAARQYGEMNAMKELLLRNQQGSSEIKDSEQADDFVGNFWNKSASAGQQQQKQEKQQPNAQVNVQQVVRQELGQIAQNTAALQAEEQILANKFRTDYPHIIAAGKANEAYVEWERLKQLRPDLPQATRYEIMRAEMERRYKDIPKNFSGSSMPSNQSQNIHPEIAQQIQQNPRSEKERIFRKSKDTARRVAEFRKDQAHRTSLSGFAN